MPLLLMIMNEIQWLAHLYVHECTWMKIVWRLYQYNIVSIQSSQHSIVKLF